jgi:23S rRNA pseudouridine1911/1915/1917 synthase
VQEAITHYAVIAEYAIGESQAFISKLRLQLETGLRHQTRVQAAQVGLPLVGYRIYNPACRTPGRGHGILRFPRQALHAARLELEHPERASQRLSWTAPLPADLARLELLLQRRV